MTTIPQRPVALFILDGYGLNPEAEGNAILAADTPNLDRLAADYPTTRIFTSGLDVGLPDGQMGNSEVGHTNIGAGRIVYQDLTRITKSIEDGDFFSNSAFRTAIRNCQENDRALHLLGLISDGGVHSHNTHLYALLRLAKEVGLTKVFIHCFYDGRDVPPDSAKGYTEELVAEMAAIGVGKIASQSGRYYAMDRDNRWERVQLAYEAMVVGSSNTTDDPVAAIQASYDADVMDEFIVPLTVVEDGQPVGLIDKGDSVIFFNFRPDRAREITRALMQPDFSGFPLPYGYLDLTYVTMTQYDATFTGFPGLLVAFGPESLDNTFGEYISRLGLKQLRIAETEKYAHVTFFFNGGTETEYEGEDRALLASPKVLTYDLKPEMSAPEVTAEALKRIASDKYDVIILNFANCDMVGHTGIFSAAVQAVEAVDKGVGQLADAILAKGGIVLITADHGNAEQMVDPTSGGPFTAHTTLPVRLIVAGAGPIALREGRLADLAPTMLDLMQLEQPAEMTGESLIIRTF